MYKAKIATAAIHKALELTSELTVPVGIFGEASAPVVHVLDIRNLEQIPGETEYKSIGPNSRSGVEASRTYDGVKFYTLMTLEQYEAYQR